MTTHAVDHRGQRFARPPGPDSIVNRARRTIDPQCTVLPLVHLHCDRVSQFGAQVPDLSHSLVRGLLLELERFDGGLVLGTDSLLDLHALEHGCLRGVQILTSRIHLHAGRHGSALLRYFLRSLLEARQGGPTGLNGPLVLPQGAIRRLDPYRHFRLPLSRRFQPFLEELRFFLYRTQLRPATSDVSVHFL